MALDRVALHGSEASTAPCTLGRCGVRPKPDACRIKKSAFVAVSVLLLVGSAGAQSWVQVLPASNPGVRAFHAMAYDGARGKVVMFGGQG